MHPTLLIPPASQVRRPDGMLVAVLGKGKFFGEMALLAADLKRQCRVEAISICDIYGA